MVGQRVDLVGFGDEACPDSDESPPTLLNPLSLPPQSFKLNSACLTPIHCLHFDCLSGLEEAILGAGPGELSTPGAAFEVISARGRGRACESYCQALMRWKYTRCHWTKAVCVHWSGDGEPTRCQRSLMGARKSSSKVVLKSWRREVEEMMWLRWMGTEGKLGEGTLVGLRFWTSLGC